jgi:uncharacterized protein YidB (DUF937 family)
VGKAQRRSHRPRGASGLLGGLGGLLERFQQGPHGNLLNSWIGTGQNQPISPGQLGTALRPDIIKVLAQRSGLSEAELTSQLSKVLPGVVDKLTPNGRIPTLAGLSALPQRSDRQECLGNRGNGRIPWPQARRADDRFREL